FQPDRRLDCPMAKGRSNPRSGWYSTSAVQAVRAKRVRIVQWNIWKARAVRIKNPVLLVITQAGTPVSNAIAAQVYVYLLRMYLSPPDPHNLGVMSGAVNPQPNVQAALDILMEHSSKIDTAKALAMLPSGTQIKDICSFLENVLEEKAMQKRNMQVLKSLLYAEHLQFTIFPVSDLFIIIASAHIPRAINLLCPDKQTHKPTAQPPKTVQEQRMFYQSSKCIITEEKMCRVCKKKIGNRYRPDRGSDRGRAGTEGDAEYTVLYFIYVLPTQEIQCKMSQNAFARYPNGVIVHYFCCKDRNVCPVDS
ncbi:Vam6/Vps39-like protein, partial [Branchiostoma belcheri]